MHPVITAVQVPFPDWLTRAQSALPARVPDADDRATLVDRLALQNVEADTGGPFAAIVTRDDGTVAAAGVNLVTHAQLSSMHAEVVALSAAQTALGAWDLGDAGAERLTLTVNAQPCVMCLGAVIWSGVRRLEFAVTGQEVERITGFDEGPVPADWRDQLARRGIEVVHTAREDSLRALQRYRARVDDGSAVLYNSSRG